MSIEKGITIRATIVENEVRVMYISNKYLNKNDELNLLNSIFDSIIENLYDSLENKKDLS